MPKPTDAKRSDGGGHRQSSVNAHKLAFLPDTRLLPPSSQRWQMPPVCGGLGGVLVGFPVPAADIWCLFAPDVVFTNTKQSAIALCG